ncbi:MAG: hypothetical protein C4290_01775 [Chloroflexota bacterium]
MASQIATVLRVILGTKMPPPAGIPSRPARVMPPRLRVYLMGVCGAYALLQLSLLASRVPLPWSAVGTAAGLSLLVALARIFPVQFAPKRKLIVDTAPCFAAALLLPPAVAMATTAAGMLAGELRVRGRWFQAAFNTSVAGLRVASAAFIYRWTAGIPLRAAGSFDPSVPALLLAATVQYVVGTVLVDLAAGLTLGQNPFSGWLQGRKLPAESVLFILGLVGALPAAEHPWVLPLLIVPGAIVRHSLQAGITVKSEAREALESLAQAVDLRHQRAADHSRRVAELARAIARRMELSPRDVALIADAALLRDIGEVALPPELLTTSRTLTDEERAELRRHAAIGAEMVARFPDLQDCAPLILHHHERWDGWGTPHGLTGEAIPLGARIIAVAETYEALIAPRPYREALTPAQARAELRRCAGSQLDPYVVTVLLELLGESPQGAGPHPRPLWPSPWPLAPRPAEAAVPRFSAGRGAGGEGPTGMRPPGGGAL